MSRDVVAFHLINHLDEQDLGVILKKYGEEKMYRQVAKAIVDSRNSFGAITTTEQLAKVVDSVFLGYNYLALTLYINTFMDMYMNIIERRLYLFCVLENAIKSLIEHAPLL